MHSAVGAASHMELWSYLNLKLSCPRTRVSMVVGGGRDGVSIESGVTNVRAGGDMFRSPG